MSRVITKVRFFVQSSSSSSNSKLGHSWPMNIDGSTKEGGVPSRYVGQKMMRLEVTPKIICHPAPGPRRQTRVNINSFSYNRKECHHLMQRCHLSSTPHLSSSQLGCGYTVKRHPRKIGTGNVVPTGTNYLGWLHIC